MRNRRRILAFIAVLASPLGAIPTETEGQTAPDRFITAGAFIAAVGGPELATESPKDELLADLVESLQAPARPPRATLVAIEQELPITEKPGKGPQIGVMPTGSPWFNIPTVAWVEEISRNGRFGQVQVPYSATRATGWMPIEGLKRHTTPFKAHADISERTLTVTRRGKKVLRLPVAIGTTTAPTPPGRYFVTDLIPFDPNGPLGAFAFGLSGIQPNLPPGWAGGDQLAVHGTNDPSSIGTAVTAGCLRVTNADLERLKPFLKLGTPVVFKP
jgi:lipoprotein-anchoring transpeptidase ErfK/SrfK